MAFCINCGQELTEGSKFCAGCGKAVSDNSSTSQRKIIYEGEIYKCPNCGDILDAYESVCEICGYERRGEKATGSVRELQLKLEELSRQLKLILAWCVIHQDELMQNWELSKDGLPLNRINPLV